MHQHEFTESKITGGFVPEASTHQVQIEYALSKAQQVEEKVGSDVCITEAFVEETGVEVEMLHALVTLFAMLEMHVLFCQADEAELIERGELLLA